MRNTGSRLGPWTRQAWSSSEEQKYDTVRVFKDYREHHGKVKGQSGTSIARITKYDGKTDIVIPMSYGLVLI